MALQETPLKVAVDYPPAAATMRLDGGHPALELVNTLYGQLDGPVEHDVLTTPEDLVTFARRLGFAEPHTPTSGAALTGALALRGAVDALLRARAADTPPPDEALVVMQDAAQAAIAAARLDRNSAAFTWTWPADEPYTPVHRLADASITLLRDEEELARLHQCAGCRWLFLDHSRGAGRRWCSMADCGMQAKKLRYVQRRRERREHTQRGDRS